MKKNLILVLHTIAPIIAEYGNGEQLVALQTAIDKISDLQPENQEIAIPEPKHQLLDIKPIKFKEGNTIFERLNFDPSDLFGDMFKMMETKEAESIIQNKSLPEQRYQMYKYILETQPEMTKKWAIMGLLFHDELPSGMFAATAAHITANIMLGKSRIG